MHESIENTTYLQKVEFKPLFVHAVKWTQLRSYRKNLIKILRSLMIDLVVHCIGDVARPQMTRENGDLA